MAEANDTPTCTMCGNGFEQRKGQGRPFQKCPDCRAKPTYQRKQYAPRQCQWCAEEFVPLRVDTRFCSKRCMYANVDSRRPPRDRSKDKPATRQASCEVCGTAFESYRSTGAPGGWTRCCCMACSRVARRLRDGTHRVYARVAHVMHFTGCTDCGVRQWRPTRGGFRCDGCAVQQGWEPKERKCIGCGAAFTQRGGRSDAPRTA